MMSSAALKTWCELLVQDPWIKARNETKNIFGLPASSVVQKSGAINLLSTEQLNPIAEGLNELMQSDLKHLYMNIDPSAELEVEKAEEKPSMGWFNCHDWLVDELTNYIMKESQSEGNALRGFTKSDQMDLQCLVSGLRRLIKGCPVIKEGPLKIRDWVDNWVSRMDQKYPLQLKGIVSDQMKVRDWTVMSSQNDPVFKLVIISPEQLRGCSNKEQLDQKAWACWEQSALVKKSGSVHMQWVPILTSNQYQIFQKIQRQKIIETPLSATQIEDGVSLLPPVAIGLLMDNKIALKNIEGFECNEDQMQVQTKVRVNVKVQNEDRKPDWQLQLDCSMGYRYLKRISIPEEPMDIDEIVSMFEKLQTSKDLVIKNLTAKLSNASLLHQLVEGPRNTKAQEPPSSLINSYRMIPNNHKSNSQCPHLGLLEIEEGTDKVKVILEYPVVKEVPELLALMQWIQDKKITDINELMIQGAKCVGIQGDIKKKNWQLDPVSTSMDMDWNRHLAQVSQYIQLQSHIGEDKSVPSKGIPRL